MDFLDFAAVGIFSELGHGHGHGHEQGHGNMDEGHGNMDEDMAT
jgi:hypothetical protein